MGGRKSKCQPAPERDKSTEKAVYNEMDITKHKNSHLASPSRLQRDSFKTEQRFAEIQGEHIRKEAVEKIFNEEMLVSSDEMSKEEETRELQVQFNLVRSMIPDIVYESFAEKHTKHPSMKPEHSHRRTYLAFFDIKGFSSYAADLDIGNRTTNKMIDSLREKVTEDLLGTCGLNMTTDLGSNEDDGSDDEEELSQVNTKNRAGIGKRSLLKTKFHRQSTHAGEQLQQTLNATLHEILVCASRSRVDVVKFAGDALLCALWKGQDDPSDAQMLCSLLIFAKDVESILAERKGTFRLHIGVSHGNVLCVNTGASVDRPAPNDGSELESYSRFEFFVTGKPVVEAGQALDNASECGDICVSSASYRTLTEDEKFCKEAFHKLSFRAADKAKQFFVLEDFERDNRIYCHLRSLPSDFSPPPMDSIVSHKNIAVLSKYIPAYARSFVTGTSQDLQTGQAAMSTVGCKRVVSIMFVHIPWLDTFDADDPNADADSYLRNCNDLMMTLLQLISEYEMCLRQVMVDDKGAVAIVVVGCPPLTHDENATRACFGACSLQFAHNKKLRIGISTGKTYCGLVGNAERYEFAVVGDIVNISARLMNAASPGECVCDQATRIFASSSALCFTSVSDGILLKGQQSKSKVYRVSHENILSSAKSKGFVERTMHQKALLKFLSSSDACDRVAEERVSNGNDGTNDNEHTNDKIPLELNRPKTNSKARASAVNAYVISGERGVGKTSLLEWSINAARGVNAAESDPSLQTGFVAYVHVTPSSMKTHLPAWSKLIENLLQFETHEQQVVSRLKELRQEGSLKKQEFENEGENHLTDLVQGQMAIASTARSIIKKRSSFVLTDMKGQTVENSQGGQGSGRNDKTSGGTVNLQKRRRMRTILYTNSGKSQVLKVALKNASKLDIEASDFQILRYFGIVVDYHDIERTSAEQQTKFKQYTLQEVLTLTKKIIMCLILAVKELQPGCVVIVFDGAELFDESSWDLFAKICDGIEEYSICGVKLIASCCLSTCIAGAECESVIYRPDVRWLQISDLSYTGMDILLCKLFETNQVNVQLSAFFWENTQGNPGRLMRYVEHLVTQRLLSVTEGPRPVLQPIKGKHALLCIQEHNSAEYLRRYDRLSKESQLLLEILVVFSIQTEEILNDTLFKIFRMCLSLYLPAFLRKRRDLESLEEAFSQSILTLIMERFVSVHKGMYGTFRGADTIPSNLISTSTSEDDSESKKNNDDPSVQWSDTSRDYRIRSMIGGPAVTEMSHGDEEEKFFFSADPTVFMQNPQRKRTARTSRFGEFYSPSSQRVRECIYASISDGRRRSLHKDICLFLESLLQHRGEELGPLEEVYAMLAGHCRMAGEPFRCFRFYELASEVCIGKGDYLNAIYVLKLCCLACAEFEGFTGGGQGPVIDNSRNLDVLLRFGKWHLQIGKLFIKFNRDLGSAQASVERAWQIFNGMAASLVATGTISRSLFWIGTSTRVPAELSSFTGARSLKDVNKVEEVRPTQYSSSRSSQGSASFARSSGKSSSFTKRISQTFSRQNQINPAGANSPLQRALGRVRDAVSETSWLLSEIKQLTSILDRTLAKTEENIELSLDGRVDLERARFEQEFTMKRSGYTKSRYKLAPSEAVLATLINRPYRNTQLEHKNSSLKLQRDETAKSMNGTVHRATHVYELVVPEKLK